MHRFVRGTFKVIRTASVFGGLTGQLIPYMGIAIAFKGILVAFEGYGWWPVIDNLNTVIAVAGVWSRDGTSLSILSLVFPKYRHWTLTFQSPCGLNG